MSSKQSLILVVSKKMNTNKKEGRNEDNLVRMSKKVRSIMGFGDSAVELDREDNNSRSVVLNIFQAFSDDIKAIKKNGDYTKEEINRIAFVTQKTFNRICGTSGDRTKKYNNIWISKNVEKLMLGADPEFLLFNGNGDVVYANDVLPHSGPIGSDGAMAEVRPYPSTDVNIIVKNMAEIFKSSELTKNIKDYKWKSACYHKNASRDFPVGGHIHIGNPAVVERMHQRRKNSLFCVINKIMDELLAIPLIKLDGSKDGKDRRINCKMSPHAGYGFYGEWRPCDGRLEHRTLSGMWLTHPTLSKVVLGTAKAIVREAFKHAEAHRYEDKYTFPIDIGYDFSRMWDKGVNHGWKGVPLWQKDFDRWKDIPLAVDMCCTTDSGEMINKLHSSDLKHISSSYLKAWYEKIKSLSTYRRNSEYIDALYEVLNIPYRELSKFPRDLKTNWLNDKEYLVEI